jgi:hypothetical protein
MLSSFACCEPRVLTTTMVSHAHSGYLQCLAMDSVGLASPRPRWHVRENAACTLMPTSSVVTTRLVAGWWIRSYVPLTTLASHAHNRESATKEKSFPCIISGSNHTGRAHGGGIRHRPTARPRSALNAWLGHLTTNSNHTRQTFNIAINQDLLRRCSYVIDGCYLCRDASG